MSDDKDTKKPLSVSGSVSGRKTLQLKPSVAAVPTSSRAPGGVVVQRKKKLMLKPGEQAPVADNSPVPSSAAVPEKTIAAQVKKKPQSSGGRQLTGRQLTGRQLTESELKARANA